MDTSSLIEIIKDNAIQFQPIIQGAVGALLTTLFLRKNAGTSEFEKIKAGKFEEALEMLLENGKMTYFELYKCRNFLKIATLADQYKQQNNQTNKSNESFDFDWFVRFFDAAGNISNIEMQKLWGKILSEEIDCRGSFSLRSLETLKNMNQTEALLFQTIANLVLTEQNGLKFILCMSDDLGKDINEEYGIGKNEFVILEECGILSSIRSDNRISLNSYPSGIWNGSIILVLHYKRSDGVLNSYKYSSYTLTQSACQLLSIVDTDPNNEYLIKIGRELAKKYSGNLHVSAHNILSKDISSFIYDEDNDLLKV